MSAKTLSFTNNEFLGAPWIDRNTGEEVQVLAPNERMPVSALKGPKLHCGKYLRGLITNRWDGAEAEKLAMGGYSNAAGGILVPEGMFADVIDLARAQAVLFRAGALTVPMTTDSMVMARITADPTLEMKAENAAFTGTEVALDGITLTSNTYGNIVTASRELIEDAPNAADVIQNSLARALAVGIDTLGLVGSGAGTIHGVVGRSDVGTTGSVGTLAWSHLQTAVQGIGDANGNPNAYVVAPINRKRLAALKSGDGTNSAAMWQGPPSDVEPLTQLVTTSAPNGTIIMGDFSKCLFGIRHEAQIEVTTTGGDTFAKHQMGIKIVWRGDFNLTYPSHFYTLTGISG